jgi:hypothetical protein
MRGGRREGAGRPPGSPNALTSMQKRSLSDIAGDHTIEAVETLVAIMSDVNVSAAARVSAAIAVLDRGHGRPAQTVAVAPAASAPHIDFSVLTDEELESVHTAITIMDTAQRRQPGGSAMPARIENGTEQIEHVASLSDGQQTDAAKGRKRTPFGAPAGRAEVLRAPSVGCPVG